MNNNEAGITPSLEPTPDDIRNKILKEKKPFTLDELAQEIHIGVGILHETIDSLIEEGYTFQKVEDYYLRSKNRKQEISADHSSIFKRDFSFGIVSDTHLGSKQERLDAINSMYDIFEKEGIGVVYHIGDITDGFGMYRGQEFEVHKLGQQEQIDYTKKVYPKGKNITTYFITGNHDLKQYERGGVDVGNVISQRKDLHYLGQAMAQVKIGQDVIMELLHPAGGISYALSYKAQRDINNRNPNDLPNILVYGHYHVAFYMHYRGIDFIQAGCFKDAGIWERRLGLNPVIGGWIVEGKMTDDSSEIERFNPHLFTFDKARKRE